MLRSLVAILTVIYFVVSSGVVMNVHYCMGKRQSVNLEILAAKKCGCGKSEKKGCCKTESSLIKLEDVQKASYTNYSIEAPVAYLEDITGTFQAAIYCSPEFITPVGHSPPHLSKQDTYLQNRVFRI